MTAVAVNNRCQQDGKIADSRSDLVGVTGFEPVAPRSQTEVRPSGTVHDQRRDVRQGCRRSRFVAAGCCH